VEGGSDKHRDVHISQERGSGLVLKVEHRIGDGKGGPDKHCDVIFA